MRRGIPLFFLYFLLLSCVTFADQPKRVLLISVDTLRADYLSCYGQKRLQTPNIDSLAATGITFDHAVSQVPLTLPSHTSILTGLYPTHHGIHDNSGFYLDSRNQVSIANIFQKQGFATAAFVASFPLDSRFGLNQGFQTYNDPLPMRLVNNDMALPELPASSVIDAALSWLKSVKNDRWFLWIHLFDAHHPYFPPEAYRKQYPRNFYAGEIRYVDDQLGRVFEYLKESNRTSTTLFVFTADHGESLGMHQERTHGVFAYESTLRVPLILAGSGIPQSQRISNLVRLIDIAPTILDLMKLAPPSKMDGVSLAELWRKGAPETAGRQSYFESMAPNLNFNWAPLRGFYTGQYKFIDLPLPELYDMRSDRAEQTNLCSGDSALCERYRKQYEKFAQSVGVAPVTAQVEVDLETAEKLRALGYVTSSQKAGPKESYGVEDDPKTLVELDNMINDALGYHHAGEEQKAVETLERVLAKRANMKLAYLHLAFFYDDLGKTDQAAAVLKRAIANKVEDSVILSKLGLYLSKLGQFGEAIPLIQRAVQVDPRDLESRNYLGMAYTNSQRYEEAEKVFQQAVSLDPTAAVTYNNLGVLLVKQKKLPQALQNYQTAVKYAPQMAAAFNGIGVVYAKMNQPEEAIQNWKKAVELDPQQLDAQLNIGYTYLKLNQSQLGLQALQDFLSKASPQIYGSDIEKAKEAVKKLQSQSN